MNETSTRAVLGFVSAQNSNMLITLIVFVSLTALLAAFIIALFASKRFRGFFFKEKQPDRKEKHEPPRSTAHAPTGKTNATARPAPQKQPNVDHRHTAKKPTAKSSKPSAPHTRKNGK